MALSGRVACAALLCLFVSASANCVDVYEAEDASIDGAVARSKKKGFTGDGYVEFGSTSILKWEIPPCVTDGQYGMTLRYSAKKEKHAGSLALKVNGKLSPDLVSLPETGGWSKWREITVQIDLVGARALDNTIEITYSGVGSANIDHMSLTAVDDPCFAQLEFEAELATYVHPKKKSPKLKSKRGVQFVKLRSGVSDYLEFPVNSLCSSPSKYSVSFMFQGNSKKGTPIEVSLDRSDQVNVPASRGNWIMTPPVVFEFEFGANKVKIEGAHSKIDKMVLTRLSTKTPTAGPTATPTGGPTAGPTAYPTAYPSGVYIFRTPPPHTNHYPTTRASEF